MHTLISLTGFALAAAALFTTGILVAANNPKLAAKFKSTATRLREEAEAKLNAHKN